MNNLAFDFASQSPSFHEGMIAKSTSKMPEVLPKMLEIPANDDGSAKIGGKPISQSSSPYELIRRLAKLIAPDQPAKVCIPRLHHALVKHSKNLSLRRVRALYNGEVARAWGDELDALRREVTEAENAEARRAFARAAIDLQRQLAAYGAPLTDHQCQALGQIVEGNRP